MARTLTTVAFALLLTACGDDSAPSTAGDAGADALVVNDGQFVVHLSGVFVRASQRTLVVVEYANGVLGVDFHLVLEQGEVEREYLTLQDCEDFISVQPGYSCGELELSYSPGSMAPVIRARIHDSAHQPLSGGAFMAEDDYWIP